LQEPDGYRNFVFSFSEKGDELSQWRAYANDGLGFTIGVDATCLSEQAKVGNDFDFSRFSYSERHLENRLQLAIKHIEVALNRYDASHLRADVFNRAAGFFDVVAATVSASYKHSSFQLEAEWRLKAFVSEDDLHDQVRIREKNGLLVPYIELDICDSDKLPIRRIGIGPGYANSEIG
jgi:hypothetical protein